MGLKKGQTNNPNGRPKGSKNRTTQDLRERISDFIGDEWERVMRDFKRLPLPERMRFFERLLGYVLPKLQNVEYTTPDQLSYFIDSAGPITEEEQGIIDDYKAAFDSDRENE